MKINKKESQVGKFILELLKKTQGPLSVSEMLQVIKVNKTSIYRQILSLLSHNLISEVDFGEGVKRYEILEMDHHHHLVCTNCKRIEEVTIDEVFDRQEKKLEKKTGFVKVKHSLEFYGVCAACK